MKEQPFAWCVPQTIRDQIIPHPQSSPVAKILALYFPPNRNDSNGADCSLVPIYGDLPPNLPEVLSPDSLAFFRRFLSRCVPHYTRLQDGFNNARLLGLQSIVMKDDPSYRVPLWSERLVGDMRIFERQCAQWNSASKWLSQVSCHDNSSADLVEECSFALNHIPYAGTVSGFSSSINLSISDLASFLSNDWLNDEMINAGAEYMIRQLGPHNRRHIASCFLMPSLRSAHARSNRYSPRQLTTLDALIKNNALDILYLPLHVMGNHWTFLEINIAQGTYSYVDSLNPNASPPDKTIDIILWWLDALHADTRAAGISLAEIPPVFQVMRQRDNYSCGIIVLCSLGHILLNYTPWSPDRYHCGRMEWFLRIAEDMLSIDALEETDDIQLPHVDRIAASLRPSPTTNPAPTSSMEIDFIELTPEIFTLAEPCLPSPPVSPDSPTGSTGGQSHSLSNAQYVSNIDSDTNGDDSTSDTASNVSRKRRRVDGGKPGSSYVHQKHTKLRSKQDPTFRPSVTRTRAFRAKILQDDSHAEFHNKDALSIRCSSCSKWVRMRFLYDTLHWKGHRSSKACQDNRKKKDHRTQSLFTHGFGRVPPKPALPTTSIPCPGLSRASDPKVDAYLYRSNATGGGAPSRQAIADQIFGAGDGVHVKYSDLSSSEKRMVFRHEETLYKWRNSRAMQAVYATNCENLVTCPTGQEPTPCYQCRSLYQLNTFRVRINRPIPDEDNMKHVPKVYRDEELGDIYLRHRGVRGIIELDNGQSPWLKFAQGIAAGLYKEQSVLLGMIEAMVSKTRRLLQGKTLANMKYSKGFNEFCNIMASLNPRSYKTFNHHFGGPAIRSMRKMRARLPRFAPGIAVINIEKARAVLDSYGYTGPIALSWDDTELDPALAAYQETKETVLVLGAASGIKKLSSMDDLDAFFEESKFDQADKLRIWLATIPLPKIPPILLAAVARGSSVSAEDLHTMHVELTTLLHNANIHPISQSSDGSETERAVQRLIMQNADSILPYCILNATPGCRIDLNIPIYQKHPTVLTQDSKHARKTARNQLFTGARLIVIANFCIFFSMVHEMAENILSPLFKRDVEKVDRQDDQAAARLFSSQLLNFQMTHYAQHRGLTVYLFILGELVDAWQSRNLIHLERAKMAMRARFFLMAWRSHIVNHPDYSVNIQFISREAYDIFITLCDSLVSLIIAYRKYYPAYPLLHWLHTSEPCEHVFGVWRQIKPNINYADALFLVPKLRALLLGDFSNLTAEQQGNQTSAGYHHTYFKADDLDLHALLVYPSDDDLAKASEAALTEARELLASLGIDADKMLATYEQPKHKPPRTYRKTPPRQPQTMAELMTLFKDIPLSNKDEAELEACEMALAAESVDKTLEIDDLPESPNEETSQVKATLSTYHNQPQLEPLPTVAVEKNHRSFKPDAISFVTGRSLNQKALVSQRERHQPKETSLAIRKLGRDWSAPAKEESLQAVLRRRLQGIAARAPSTTSGVGRQVRHTSTFAGASSAPGRQKNKQVAQDVAAADFVRHRSTALRHLQSIHEHVHSANISEYNPLRRGHLMIALCPTTAKSKASPQLLVGEVVAMYTKADYRGAMHESRTELQSAGLPSYIYLQVYSSFSGAIMTSLSCPSLATTTFLQIPRTHILFSLASYGMSRVEVTSADAHPFTMLTLGPEAHALVSSFLTQLNNINYGVKTLKGLVSSRGIGSKAEAADNPEVLGGSDSDFSNSDT